MNCYKKENIKKKIWKYYKRIYLWILSNFMTVEDKYQNLQKWKIQILNDLETTILNLEKFGYLFFTQKETDKLYFRIGDKKFMLLTEINPYAEIVKYKTYEIILNLDNAGVYKFQEIVFMLSTTDLSCNSKIKTTENIKANLFSNIYLKELRIYVETSFQNS